MFKPSFESSIQITPPVEAFHPDYVEEDFFSSPFFSPLSLKVFTHGVSFYPQVDKACHESPAIKLLQKKHTTHHPQSLAKEDKSTKIKANKTKLLERSKRSTGLYRSYLKKRIEETGGYISTKQLLEEIRVRGYLGGIRAMQQCCAQITGGVSLIRETPLDSYRNYLKKRIEETDSGDVSAKHLFEEIKEKGYLGSFSTMQQYLSMIRKKKNKPQEAFLQFHKNYLNERFEQALPGSVPPKQLFEEIKARGYQGSCKTMRTFLSAIRKIQGAPKDYLKNRLEEAAPNYLSSKQLFKEIKAKGYQGAFSTMRAVLPALRKQQDRPKGASLEPHKNYLKKRVEKAYPKGVSAKQLLKEIKARGYLGKLGTIQLFLRTIQHEQRRLLAL